MKHHREPRQKPTFGRQSKKAAKDGQEVKKKKKPKDKLNKDCDKPAKEKKKTKKKKGKASDGMDI